MTAPTPKTITQEVADDLSRLLSESDRYRDKNSAPVLEIQHKIARLKKADRVAALSKEGALASLCGEPGWVDECYRQVSFLPDEPIWKSDFWTSYANVGCYAKAHELGHWLLSPRRGFFPRIWHRAASLGHIQELADTLDQEQRTYPELVDEDFSKIQRAATCMRQWGLADTDVIDVLDIMGGIQRDHKIGYHGDELVWTVVESPEEDPYLFFRIAVAVSIAELVEMNRTLVRNIVERLPKGAFPEGLSASFMLPAEAAPARLAA